MLRALSIARTILALGSEAADLFEALAALMKDHSPRTQRAALDAAYGAAETELARRFRP